VALEYMAQCIAAHEGYRAWREGRKLDLGLFVGARRVHFHRADFQGIGELEVRVRYLRGRAGLGALSYACEIRREDGAGDEVWVEGTLNVALPDTSADAASGVES
jgi:predicted hotdog family 3-hydroxylacyl-ACP dehydratase